MYISSKSKKETVNELLEKGYEELYVVDVFIENKREGTNQFYVYANKEDAFGYIKNCETFDKMFKDNFRKTDDGYKFDAMGDEFTVKFVVEVYKRAA